MTSAKVMASACGAGLLLLFTNVARAESPPESLRNAAYTIELGTSYAVLPVLGVAALLPLADANEDLAIPLGAGVVVLGLSAPVLVHALNGESGRAAVSPFGAIGTSAVGALVGLGIGAMVADATCPTRNPSGEQSGWNNQCGLATVGPAFLTGAAVGYVGWAAFDTVTRSNADSRPAPSVAVSPSVSRAGIGLHVIGTF